MHVGAKYDILNIILYNFYVLHDIKNSDIYFLISCTLLIVLSINSFQDYNI